MALEFVMYNTTGSSKIRVDYDGTISCLKIDNNIIVVTVEGPYPDPINVYHVKGYSHNALLNFALKDIEFDFYTKANLFREKSSSVERLLEIFEPGSFCVEHVTNFVICEIVSNTEFVFGSFDDHSPFLFATKQLNSLDRTTIDLYKQQIIDGSKPIILSYRKDYSNGSLTGNSFLIDGHHKLVAYKELNVEPYIWEIANLVHHDYDELDQSVCQYLNHQKIESLKYSYTVEGDSLGNVIKLKPRL
ncbi:hypothetical protein AAFN85_24435 [Mucilaginibacter sp. CAU 1740]|uniref:hypothetical protein n=1 Tax=Mucilaginibacter sp. CAU 1740 TaxID=3140365 RepID=UPI00325A59F6